MQLGAPGPRNSGRAVHLTQIEDACYHTHPDNLLTGVIQGQDTPALQFLPCPASLPAYLQLLRPIVSPADGG